MLGAVHVFLQIVKDKLIEFMKDEDEVFDALFKVCARICESELFALYYHICPTTSRKYITPALITTEQELGTPKNLTSTSCSTSDLISVSISTFKWTKALSK